MSLYSSTVGDGKHAIMKKKSSNHDPTPVGTGQLNKSKSNGLISKRKHGFNFEQLTDMKEASLTINSNLGVVSPD